MESEGKITRFAGPSSDAEKTVSERKVEAYTCLCASGPLPFLSLVPSAPSLCPWTRHPWELQL